MPSPRRRRYGWTIRSANTGASSSIPGMRWKTCSPRGCSMPCSPSTATSSRPCARMPLSGSSLCPCTGCPHHRQTSAMRPMLQKRPSRRVRCSPPSWTTPPGMEPLPPSSAKASACPGPRPNPSPACWGTAAFAGPASRRDRGRHDGKGLGTGRGRHGHPAGRGSLSARVPLPAGQAHRLHVQGCRCPLLLRAARPGSQGRSLRQRGRPRPPRLPGTSGPGRGAPSGIRTYRRRAWPMSSIPPAPQACPRG